MIVARIFRLLAATAFVLLAAWATPAGAHPGHDGPSAFQSQQPATISSVAKRSATEHVPAAKAADGAAAPAAAATDCSVDAGSGGTAVCCGHACHAAMADDLTVLLPLPIATTAAPSIPGPIALAGPTIHIKRPPRPLAVPVG
jgi:hypothetical protein